MKTEPEYQLDDYIFWDRSNWFDRFGHALTNIMVRFSKTSPLAPSIHYKKDSMLWRKIVTLVAIGKAVGIKDEEKINILNAHQKRHVYYQTVSAVLTFFIMYIPLALSAFLTIFSTIIITNFAHLNTDSIAFKFSMSILLVIITWTVGLYGIRIASFIADRYFADTLCIMASLDLLIELSRDNSLVVSDMQRSLLFKLRILARNILLLPYCYESPYDANNAWASEYFKVMAGRVREYERWVIAPKENTLSDLRKEINELTHMFISRNFGSVSYELPPVPEIIPQSRQSQFARLIVRFIGVAIPGFILVILYLYPIQVSNTGLDKNIVGLIALAWILLTIDASLGLGVVEKISGLAKAIKDLK
jgi:hypothetical protein